VEEENTSIGRSAYGEVLGERGGGQYSR